MNSYYYGRQQYHHSREENTTLVVVVLLTLTLASAGYILVDRFHFRPSQLVELGIYVACLVCAAAVTSWYCGTLRKRREDAWPHPPISIPMLRDHEHVQQAFARNSIVLGYDVHRQPWLWPDDIRVMQALLIGQNGAGKTTLLRNVITQDVHRVIQGRDGEHRIPIIVVDGKGDHEFLDQLLPEIAAAGRMHQLRILDPSRSDISVRYNPFFSKDGSYVEHANFIFQSFALKQDFFHGHQATYLNDLARVLWYTGKRFNIHDILVMALDQQVLREQVLLARSRIEHLSGVSEQQRLNFEMSVRLLQVSFEDRERVAKIQGLLNELMTFLEDELSIITGPYEDLLTLDDVIEQELILFVSLNTNRNARAVTALGRMLLQNLQLMVGKRYQSDQGERESKPLVSVILDEFAPFAYPDFAQILQTARGSRTAFLFSLQSISQLLSVSRGFQADVSSAPNTIMLMRTRDEDTARYFLNASAKVTGERRTMTVERKGVFNERYEEMGFGSVTEIQKTRAEDYQIKNLPVGQMQVLQTDNTIGTLHSHLHVRRTREFRFSEFEPVIYPRLMTPRPLSEGANLRFKNPEVIQQRARIHGRGREPRWT